MRHHITTALLLAACAPLGPVALAQTQPVTRAATTTAPDTLAARAKAGDPDALYELATLSLTKPIGYQQALDLYRKAAAKGHAPSIERIGTAHFLGEMGLPVDRKEALAWFSKAKDDVACALYARHVQLLLEADDARRDEIQADIARLLADALKKAEAGDTRAATAYGFVSIETGVTGEHRRRAVELLRKAADAGHVRAMQYAGMLEIRGVGIPANREQGMALLKRAAESGEPGAVTEFAVETLRGVSAEEAAPALRALERMAESHGYLPALLRLAEVYTDGRRTGANPKLLVEYLSRAAERGSTDAMNQLAFLYFSGRGGVTKDVGAARTWFERAVEAGDANAPLQLGYYEIHTAPSRAEGYQRAQKHFRLAVERGNAEAMRALAQVLEETGGKDGDKKEPTALLMRAAKRGDVISQYTVGLRHISGLGVEKNQREALAWLERAFAGGELRAAQYIAALHVAGASGAKDPARAAAILQVAASRGDPGSMFMLGECYESGTGVTRDLDQARKWYEKAAAAGDERAKKWLKDHAPATATRPK